MEELRWRHRSRKLRVRLTDTSRCCCLTTTVSVPRSMSPAAPFVGDDLEDGEVVQVSTFSDLERFDAAWQAVPRAAVDCEGVNLSRVGSVCLISVCLREGAHPVVFLFDTVKANPLYSRQLPAVLKNFLSSDRITKILHDCRMDADALLHCLGIHLSHVADTQVLAQVVDSYRSPDDIPRIGSDFNIDRRGYNLNNVLTKYGQPVNVAREDVDYDKEPGYWAVRPLPPRRIEHAVGDVQRLEALMDAEKSALRDKVTDAHWAAVLSQLDARFRREVDIIRSCPYHKIVRIAEPGRAGVVIAYSAAVYSRCQSFVYKQSGSKPVQFLIMAPDKNKLNTAKQLVEVRGTTPYDPADYEYYSEEDRYGYGGYSSGGSY